MNLFISHSWRNKDVAQGIYEALKPYAEVWLDINQLKPGDAITDAIEAALGGIDLMLIVWSREAAGSDGVRHEIEAATRLGTRMLPCAIDNTPLDRIPGLRGKYSLRYDPRDPGPGLMRMQAAILRSWDGDLGKDAADVLNKLTTFEGLYQYVEEYRNRGGLAGPDAAAWATRLLEGGNEAYAAMSGLRDGIGNLLGYMQATMQRVEAAGNDRDALRRILDEVRARSDAGSRELAALAGFVEGKLQEAVPKRIGPAADRYESQVRQRAGSGAGGAAAGGPEQRLLQAYVESAVQSLRALQVAASGLPSMALRQVVSGLTAYLDAPMDLVPDRPGDIRSMLDDAWLIHNTIYRCVEAGWFRPEDFPVDWNAVVQGDALALRLLPPQVRAALEQTIYGFLSLIAQEVAQYQPGFAPGPAGAYNAFMGGGTAVNASGEVPSYEDELFAVVSKYM